MRNDAEIGKDLVAPYPTGDRLSLNILRCNVASEILGVWLALNVNHAKVVAGLKDSAIEWGAKFRIGNSSHHEAW